MTKPRGSSWVYAQSGRTDAHSAPAPALNARRQMALPLAVLLMLTLGCSAADLVQRQRANATPAIPRTVVLVPTFTPTAAAQQTVIFVTPPGTGQPGVIIVPPGMDPNSVIPELPSATPTPPPTGELGALLTPGVQPGSPLQLPGTPEAPGLPTPSPLPTSSPTPEPSATPTFPPTATATPTPYIQVESGLVALRTGPGVEFPLLAQLGPGIPVAVIGRSDNGAWLQICCISGQTVWVAAAHVTIYNDIGALAASSIGPPPTSTPTGTPTITGTPTPSPTPTPHVFERAIGPQFFPTSNAYITIWAKLFIGTPPLEEPAEGYTLVVTFEGVPRPNAVGDAVSKDVFEFSAPPGAGSRVQYNYKYEYRPPDPNTLDAQNPASPQELIGTGTWSVFVSDGQGGQLSEPVTFTTAPDNPNREIYIGWVRIR